MSEEKVLTLRGKKAVWAPGGGSGPIDPKRLPEGYPYKEQSETVISEGIVSLVDDGGNISAFEEKTFDLTVGSSYKVNWNGVDYALECKAVALGAYTIPCLGNLSLLDGTVENSGEPFLIAVVSSMSACQYYALAAGDYTVSISSVSETIHTMAPEFLPALTSPNGTKYQLTVSDDGTLSAVAQS